MLVVYHQIRRLIMQNFLGMLLFVFNRLIIICKKKYGEKMNKLIANLLCVIDWLSDDWPGKKNEIERKRPQNHYLL